MIRALSMLWAVVLKELRQTLRDRRMIRLLIAAPIVQLVVFGNAVEVNVDRVPTAVVDLDQTEQSRTHLRRILADGTLREVARVQDTQQALRMLETSEAAVALIIEPGLERKAVRGDTARIQMVLDGTDPNRANVAASAVTSYMARQNQAALSKRRASVQGPRPGQVSARSRVLFNPNLNTAIFMVPGVAAMLLLLVTTIVSAMGLSRERERGTLDQIAVTPLPGYLLVLGKILPFAVIGLFDLVLALAVGAYAFDMPLYGSLTLVFGATALYLVNTLGIGLLISTISANQQQAFMGGYFFMLPAALLSGIMTPIRSMPEWLQPFTMLNPLRHYAEVLRAILLRGARLPDLHRPLLALAVTGFAICLIAAMRFRNKQG